MSDSVAVDTISAGWWRSRGCRIKWSRRPSRVVGWADSSKWRRCPFRVAIYTDYRRRRVPGKGRLAMTTGTNIMVNNNKQPQSCKNAATVAKQAEQRNTTRQQATPTSGARIWSEYGRSSFLYWETPYLLRGVYAGPLVVSQLSQILRASELVNEKKKKNNVAGWVQPRDILSDPTVDFVYSTLKTKRGLW